MLDPKITVIVPTRERCDVLEKCLRTLTSQDYGNLEILVSDNFSSDATADVVRAAGDKRIRYVNTGHRVSMSHNWEFALSHVSDGWVSFIGDDDGFSIGAIAKLATLISETGVKAIRSTFASYQWPEVAGGGHGHLISPKSHGLEIRESAVWLKKVLDGRVKYTELPMIYNGGLADLSLFQKIRGITGRFFGSLTPDVYSAVAIARLTDRYAFSFEPLCINGTSGHSTGSSFYSTSSTKRADASKKFSAEENIPFHEELPLCDDGSYPLSLHALVYEAYLQSSALQPDAPALDRYAQLETILAASGPHRDSVDAWGRRFAELHRLDFARASHDARFKRVATTSRESLRKVMNAINCDYAGSKANPIADIYEASLAMATIGDSRRPLGALFPEIRRRIRQR